MLTVTFSSVITNKSLCDGGREAGERAIMALGVKQNEPFPLKDALPYLTVSELLWCLRIVRQSQRAEADKIAWKFIYSTLMQLKIFNAWETGRDYINSQVESTKSVHNPKELIDALNTQLAAPTSAQQILTLRTILVAFEHPVNLSQMAVDISFGVISVLRFDGQAEQEELRQKQHLEELL